MSEVIYYVIQDFVSERKGDEIETYTDPVYGETYDGESFDKVYEMYRDKMYEFWKKYN